MFLLRVEATCKPASYIFMVCVSESLYTTKIQSLKVSMSLGRENQLFPEKNWHGSHQSWPKVQEKQSTAWEPPAIMTFGVEEKVKI